MSIFNICLTLMQYGTLKLIVTSYYSLRKISRYSKTAVCSAHCECVQTWINVVSLTDLKSLLSTKCCSVCCTPHTRTWITQRDLIKFWFYASVVFGQGRGGERMRVESGFA